MSKWSIAIKHFTSLQKRYTTQHNGKQCEFVQTALEALKEAEARETQVKYINPPVKYIRNGNTVTAVFDIPKEDKE